MKYDKIWIVSSVDLFLAVGFVENSTDPFSVCYESVFVTDRSCFVIDDSTSILSFIRFIGWRWFIIDANEHGTWYILYSGSVVHSGICFNSFRCGFWRGKNCVPWPVTRPFRFNWCNSRRIKIDQIWGLHSRSVSHSDICFHSSMRSFWRSKNCVPWPVARPIRFNWRHCQHMEIDQIWSRGNFRVRWNIHFVCSQLFSANKHKL